MRTTVIALMFVALVAVACSDHVPAPTTPTPTPRPGYPPAALADVPEGVLFIHPAGLESLLFRMHAREEAESVSVGWVVSSSPDGSHALTARSQTGGVISLLGVMSGSVYQEFSNVPGGVEGAIWSPDGKRLAYTQPDETAGDRSQVGVVDADTGKNRLVSLQTGVRWLAGWTAAGDVLAVKPEGLVLLGGNERSFGLPEAGQVADLAMSPDGRSAAVMVGEWIREEATGAMSLRGKGLWVLELAVGKWRELVDLESGPAQAQFTVGEELAWSPDGKLLVYQTNGGAGDYAGDWEVRRVNAQSGEDALLAKGYTWGKAWSPDGKWLALMRWKEGFPTFAGDRRLSIWEKNGRLRDLDTYVRGMAWAGKGRLLVDIPGHLSLLNPETMGVKEVFADDGKSISGLMEGVVWSPSGRYAALATPSDAYNRSSLYIIDTEEGTAELFLDEAGFYAVAWLRE